MIRCRCAILRVLMRKIERFKFNRFRDHLSSYDAIAAYSLLGLMSGTLAAVAVLAFFWGIQALGLLLGSSVTAENFEALSVPHRVGLATSGALLMAFILHALKEPDRSTGIRHVIQHLNSHYGQLPLRNAITQTLVGIVGLASGQSGGREGPGVHIGATVASVLGQHFRLPNNSLRILVACGTAASISAAFNTPLAGVIFAMEVILAEYTVVGFIPVLVAAATASVITQWSGNTEAIFAAPQAHLQSLAELPLILLLGAACGASAACITSSVKRLAPILRWPIWLRFGLAGTATGCIGAFIPEVMGMGTDTVAILLNGHVTIAFLVLLACAKVTATSLAAGVGMPVGTIGPSLVIGATIGALVGDLGAMAVPEMSSEHSLYAVVGMATTMGVLLNAPLAGILAAVELTRNLQTTMPALICMVAGTVVFSSVLRQRSIHKILETVEESRQQNPIFRLLHSTHASACWSTQFIALEADEPYTPEEFAMIESPWCIITRHGEPAYAVKTQDLLQTVVGNEDLAISNLDLRRFSHVTLDDTASVKRVKDALTNNNAEIALIQDQTGQVIAGVWSSDIDKLINRAARDG